MRVHVSIHDVAPPFRKDVERALDMAHRRGAKPALLLVPEHHGSSNIEHDPSFLAFVRDLQKDGHEIFLHGFSHRARQRELLTRGSVGAWLAQRVVSNGEAELSGLSSEETASLLAAGERVLESVGLRIDGFVPPAWSFSRGLLPVLAARGYTYTEDHLRIYSPAHARSRMSLVLNYASRTRGRLYSSVAFCRASTPLATFVPARIAIHPADMKSALLRGEVARLLDWGAPHFVGRALELFS